MRYLNRKLNAFNLSHEHKLTCEMGYLIPNLLMEVEPGDTIDLRTNNFLRAEPMVGPVMHRYDVIQHYFYWPKRCSMPKEWEGYITGGEDGNDNTSWPYMESPATGYARGSLGDYLGLPCDTRVDTSAGSTETNQIEGSFEHSAVPFRMYAEIFNYWYRNENLQSKVTWSDQPGLDTTTNTSLLKYNWPKDYFTGLLNTTQRGDPVYLPLGTSAPVYGNANGPLRIAPEGNTTNVGNFSVHSDQSLFARGENWPGSNTNVTIAAEEQPMYADLSSASAVPYRDVRLAARMNLFKELLERSGARLVEFTQQFFGVRVPDDRIMKPIFLGSHRQPLMITPVEQTSSTDATSPQGNLAGRGTSNGLSKKIRKTFVEEGLIMGIMIIMPKAEYSQGLSRMWTRKTRWDHFVPMFDVAGDQAVPVSEIYCTGDATKDNATFGYKPAFEELRRLPSTVHGEMRKGGSYTFMTGGRLFDSQPQLNSDFVKADPSNRIFAVTDGVAHHFVVECYHEIRALRLLDKHGTPAII